MYNAIRNLRYITFGVLTCGCMTLAAAAPESQRQQFKEALEAITAGRITRGLELASGLESYPLYPYLSYERLRPRLHQVKADEIHLFLQAYDGSVLAERLRTDWLKWLGRAGLWRQYVADYRPQEDVRLQCMFLSARLKTGHAEGVARDAIPLWLVGKSQPDECDTAFAELYKSPLLDDELVWQRITLAMAAGETRLAGFLAGKLSTADARKLVDRWIEVHRRPAQAIKHRDLTTDEPIVHAIIAHAVRRLARSDADAALRLWSDQQARMTFDSATRHEVDRALAIAAAGDDHPQALQLLGKLDDNYVDTTVDELRLRVAVTRQDWQWLADHAVPRTAFENTALAWHYWRARALEQLGRKDEARAAYQVLARERDYYGFLAADRLAIPYAMIDIPTRLTEPERQAVNAIPGIVRAHELLQLGYDYRARREWHFEVDRMTPRQQEIAARIAFEWNWHDRAIITMGYTGQYDDLELRFPVLHRDLIARYAAERGIDEALIYSIVRAESAFMIDARSAAGALGLMQVMPETGRETARRIGYQYKNASQLMQATPNITLGSAYLKSMLDRHAGSFPMAAAAYNAGPHRVSAWLPAKECQPADIWVESVPFRETRRYIKQTLFYAAVYQWRLQQDVTTLKSRLTAIPPRRPNPNGATC